jgi:dTMP kinase
MQSSQNQYLGTNNVEPRTSAENREPRTENLADRLMPGFLIAFEGLDQSGKQTQAELLRDRLKEDGRKARLVSFPDYGTSIGEEIARALQGEREYGADVMQLLYVANRYERKPDLQRWLDGGLILVCDRYRASSVAYGEAFGLDPAWLADMQKFLPPASLTILLDIAPDTAAKRKSADRDRYERDLALLGRVRDSYVRQAAAQGWVVLDGERSKDTIAGDVYEAVQRILTASDRGTS